MHDINAKMIFCHLQEITCYSGIGVGESCQDSLDAVRIKGMNNAFIINLRKAKPPILKKIKI